MGPEPKKNAFVNENLSFFCCYRDRYTMKWYNTTKKKITQTKLISFRTWHTIHNFIHRHRHHDHYQNKHFEHHHNPPQVLKRNANKQTNKKKPQPNRDNQSFTHNAYKWMYIRNNQWKIKEELFPLAQWQNCSRTNIITINVNQIAC